MFSFFLFFFFFKLNDLTSQWFFFFFFLSLSVSLQQHTPQSACIKTTLRADNYWETSGNLWPRGFLIAVPANFFHSCISLAALAAKWTGHVIILRYQVSAVGLWARLRWRATLACWWSARLWLMAPSMIEFLGAAWWKCLARGWAPLWSTVLKTPFLS